MKFGLDERNLAKQFLFWAAIFLPLSLFFIFGIPLWDNLTFGFSEEAYNRFLEVNKFPLYLFSTCVPLVAIVAYMHRTIQTEKQIHHTQTQLNNTLTQIQLTENKNKADSYYSHVKFVVDAINSFPEAKIKHTSPDRLEVYETFSFNQPYALYKRIFSESNLDNGYSKQTDELFRDALKSVFNNINACIYKAEKEISNLRTLSDCLSDIDSYILDLCKLLLIDYNPRNHMYWIRVEKRYRVISFEREGEFKETLNHLFSTVQRLCDFIEMESEFLRPHPLNDEEQALYFYLNTNEMLFTGVLPARDSAGKDLQLGYIYEQ